MKLIIGLGNPDAKYAPTRHNVGFRILDNFARSVGAEFKHEKKFKADVAGLSISSEKVILAKPTTYYNLSGEAARAICDFYKIEPADVLVVHDELALPFGTIRTRLGGSDAGNNGVRSINSHLGNDTARIRVGVWNELREKIDDADFVLAGFTKEETEQLSELQPKLDALITSFMSGEFETTTHR